MPLPTKSDKLKDCFQYNFIYRVIEIPRGIEGIDGTPDDLHALYISWAFLGSKFTRDLGHDVSFAHHLGIRVRKIGLLSP